MKHPRDPHAQAETRDDRLRYLALATGDAMYDWDIAAGTLWRSETYDTLYQPLQATASPLSNPPWWAEHIHPDDRARVIDSAERALREQQSQWSAEYKLRAADGSYATVLNRAHVVYGNSGSPSRMVGSVANVTSDRRREQALRLSEERHVALVKAAGQPVWVHDPVTDSAADEGGLVWWQELTGQAPDETGSWGWIEPIHPDDRERVQKEWSRSRETGSAYEVEYRIRTRTGEYRTFQVRGVPVRDACGVIREWVGMFTDVSDRRRADQAVRESEERLRRVFESGLIGFLFWDENHVVRDANDAFLDMLGYTRDEVNAGAVHCSTITAPECAAADERALAAIAEKGVCAPFEKEYIRKDGTRVPVLVGGAQVHGDRNVAVGFVLDLSDRKQLEERLRQSQKMEAVGRLAGGVAHDFNNILTVIGGNTQLALRTNSNNEELVGLLSQVRTASIRAVSLIKQLLAFGRRAIVEPVVLDLNDVVLDAEKLLRRLLDESIELELVIDPRLSRVKADRAQMDQVIVNLAVNAQQAMPQGGTLTIEARDVTVDEDAPEAIHGGVPPMRYVRLSVIDTGHGISEATRDKIFEPFFTTRERSEGTGLGLAVVYGIVQLCGGHITVESEPDKGAAFRIYLPTWQGEAEGDDRRAASSLAADDAVSAPTGDETLMLVEDDEAVRGVMRSMLVQHGYQVIDAGNGHEALRIVETLRRPIHLLVTDVVMPRMDGLQLAKALGPLQPGMLTLFLSGHADDVLKAHGVPPDSINILHKPFEAGDLARKVREVLDRKPS